MWVILPNNRNKSRCSPVQLHLVYAYNNITMSTRRVYVTIERHIFGKWDPTNMLRCFGNYKNLLDNVVVGRHLIV